MVHTIVITVLRLRVGLQCGIVDRFAAGVRISSLIQGIPSHFAAHPASYLIGDVGCCPKIKLNWLETDCPSQIVLRLGMSGAVRALSHVYLQSFTL